jgi:hypothetical protein
MARRFRARGIEVVDTSMATTLALSSSPTPLDSRIVTFKVSPGEMVRVSTPAQRQTPTVTQGDLPPVAPPVVAQAAPPPTDIDVPGPNGGHKCSACGKPGHTKAKCPDLEKSDEMSDDELERLTAPNATKPE